MTLAEVGQVVHTRVHGAVMAQKAGFAGCQLHRAHNFLTSQLLPPYPSNRMGAFGGSPRAETVYGTHRRCPPPYCLSIKSNGVDRTEQAGLRQQEALEQAKWLVDSGMVDFAEISGGNAEVTCSGLHSELR